MEHDEESLEESIENIQQEGLSVQCLIHEKEAHFIMEMCFLT